MKRLLIACVAVGALATVGDAAAQAAAATPKCRLQRAADWKVRESGSMPVVDIEVHGRKVGMAIDTGAPFSIISRELAIQLGLSRGPATEGQGEAAIIDEAKIGGLTNKNWRVLVAEQFIGRDIDVILGQDFFVDSAIEFNLPANEVRLYVPQDCDNAFLGYWDAENLRHVSIEAGTKNGVRVEVNGKPFDAVIDTGTATSVMTLSRAERLGLTPKTAGVTAGGCIPGFTRRPSESWVGSFESFTLGPQQVKNPRIHFADLGAPPSAQGRGPRSFGAVPEMILGLDFLQAHRVLISPAQRRVYFSYSGGTVFPAKTAQPCRK